MTQQKPAVLIVDDQPGIRRLLAEILSEDGHRVVVAANGYEALQLARETPLAMVLMDMKMPGLDGLTTLRELRRGGEHCPVIMMTAYGEAEAMQEALELGAARYISKPFDINAVKEIVTAAVAARTVLPDALTG